jgi:glyceraldehyde 3-phosphate dehydrogenase
MAQKETLQDWQERQELAERMLPLIGKLYRDQGVVIRIRSRPLLNSSTIDILKAHRYVKQFSGKSLDIRASFPIVEALSQMDLGPSRIDVAELAFRFDEKGGDISAFLADELKSLVESGNIPEVPQDVVLYGFGRIGRLLARLLIERSGYGNSMQLRAIVVRKGKGNDLQKRASLLRRDSVHGPFTGTIWVDEENNAIVANGTYIQVIYSDAPENVDYTEFGINNAIVVDNTGIWRDQAGLERHLQAKGVSKVLLTAPGKGDMKNIVFGVNDHEITADDTILSAASCTTNAITPVLKAVNDKYGIINGHVETVHSYTNDQNLIDNYHSAERRGRSAPLNMVITETGAAQAVAKALPAMEGKLTGNAIRVPTPNVSMAIMNLNLEKDTSKEDMVAFLRETAVHSPLSEQIDFTASTELVSSDIVGSRHASVVDSQATIANGKSCVLYLWYDNEFGYSCQVIRCVAKMTGNESPVLPA